MRRVTLVAALAAGLSAGCGFAGQMPEGFERRDYHVDPSIKFRPMSLSDIVRNPQADAGVEFDAIFNRRDENVWQAYYTPFRKGEFKAFSVWPADAAVWDARGRGRSLPTLFITGDSPAVTALYAIEQYTPVRVRGVVRSAFDSRPWVQVYYIDEIDDPWFTEESLGNLIRGLDAARTNATKAVTLLEEALDGPLSPAGQASAWKALGWIHLGRKEYAEAESCYNRALDAMPRDRQAADGLARARHKAAAGEWPEESTSKDDPPASANWKEMYTQLLTEHETSCKSVVENHAKCGDLIQAMTIARDDAVKAHAECGKGAEGTKKQLEEKDAALKTAGEKITAVEGERDAAVKAHAECGAGAEGMKKQLEEKDAALKAATEKGGADAAAVQKQVAEKDAALQTATAKVTALEAERDELKKRAEAGGDPEGLKKQIEAKDAEIKTAQSKAAELEQQVKDRDETIKKQRDEIDKLTEELKKKEGGH